MKRSCGLILTWLSDIPFVLLVYLAWKYYHKTKVVPLKQIPLIDALEQAGSG